MPSAERNFSLNRSNGASPKGSQQTPISKDPAGKPSRKSHSFFKQLPATPP